MKKKLLFTLILSWMALLASCSPITQGTLLKKNNKAGFPNVSHELDVKINWVVRASYGNQDTSFFYQPTISDHKIYTTDYRGNLLALDRKAGTLIWKINIKKPIVSSPVYGADQLFFASQDNQLYAVDASNGAINWHVSLPADVIDTPVVSFDSVTVKTLEGHLLNFDMKEGQLKWTYKETLPRLILRQNNPPKMEYPYLFAGFADGRLVALTADKGRLIWEQTIAQPAGFSELKRMVDITGELQIEDGTLYLTSYHGNVSAVDLRSGQIKWVHALSSQSGVAVNDEHVIVTDSEGMIWALNRYNGDVVWCQDALKKHDLTAPAIYQDYIVIAEHDGHVYWMSNEDGHVVASEYLHGGSILTPPVVYDESVYVISTKGQLMSLTPNL